jgi:hypothetical protein
MEKKRSRFIHVSLSRVFRHRHSFTSSTSTSPTLLSSAHLDTNHIAQHGPSKTTHSYWWSEAEHADKKRTFPVFPLTAFIYHPLPFFSNPVFFNPSFDGKKNKRVFRRVVQRVDIDTPAVSSKPNSTVPNASLPHSSKTTPLLLLLLPPPLQAHAQKQPA